MALTLKVYRGDELLSTETFDRDHIKIGRLSSAHLRLDDEKVSRIHAVIEVSAKGEISIIDMGSAEGTFVNGQRVNKSALKSGDEIRIGTTRLVLEAESSLTKEPTLVVPTKAVGVPAQAEAEASRSAAASSVPQPTPVGAEVAREPIPEPATELRKIPGPVIATDPGKGFVPEVAVRTEARVVEDTRGGEAQWVGVAALPVESASVAATHRVALPPQKELGELNDDEMVTPVNWGLEVRKLWGQTVLEVRCFYIDTDKQVLVGEREGAHFFVPGEVLPADIFPIARLIGDSATISFGGTAAGEIRLANGTVTSLSDPGNAARVGHDPEFPECRMLALPQDAVATVAFGKLAFRFRYVSRPAGYVSKMSDRVDYTFLNTLLLLLFVYAGMVATFHLRPKAVDTSEEELYKVPDRFVQFILTRPKPEKKDLSFLEKLKSDIDDNKQKSAPRYKGAEGKMGKPGAPDTGKRSAVKAIKPDDKEIVGNRGLLAVLGAGGPQGLSTVMGGTGLGGEMEGAIGNMFGPAIGDSGGFGGLGLRGTGSGGGGVGNTIGVGGLGTRGRGGGNFGYGVGVAKIKDRGERNVNISVGQPIIMGSLSMEIIRQVIHSHRDQIKYCYSQELTRNPNLQGKVSVRFTISPKGFVSQSTVGNSTLNNAAVESCITQKIRTWKFPEPKGGGIVIVNYPFILSSGG